MFGMKVSPDSDGVFPELEGRPVKVHDKGFTIARVRGDTPSGRSGVSIVVPLEDGSGLIVKTSLKLFLAAADAVRAAEENRTVEDAYARRLSDSDAASSAPPAQPPTSEAPPSPDRLPSST